MLDLASLARFVQQGVGVSGANPDYVRNTHRHMVELGIKDRLLEALVAELDDRRSLGPDDEPAETAA